MVPDSTTLLAFGLTAAVIVVSPGPDTVVILRHALTAGRPSGLGAVIGVQLGLLVHTALTAFGISALVAASPAFLKVLAVAGALYLAWLGIRLLTARNTSSLNHVVVSATVWRAGREALLTNLLNPKVLILFLSLYPNFIAASRGSIVTQIACLSGVLITINLAWQLGLVWSADRMRSWFGRPVFGRVVRLCIGIAFTALAIILAVEQVF